MEDSVATTVTAEEATKAARIWIRAFMRSANHIGDQRQAIKDQEAKIAEQASLLEQRQAFLDRCNEAIKAQAFQLGRQDRELMRLRSKVAELQAEATYWIDCYAGVVHSIGTLEATVAELQAGDVGRLRGTVNFQHAEIQRLKAAAAKFEAERDALLGVIVDPVDFNTARGIVEEAARTATLEAKAELEECGKEDATDDQRFIWEADRETLELKVAEMEADLAAAKKWIVDLTAERDEAKAAARRGTDEAKRLAAIAEHSNNLAQNRLEEAAKLRRQVAELKAAAALRQAGEGMTAAVANTGSAFQQGMTEAAKLRREVADLKESLKGRDEMIAAQSYDYQLWRHVADHATRVRFQRLRDQGFKP